MLFPPPAEAQSLQRKIKSLVFFRRQWAAGQTSLGTKSKETFISNPVCDSWPEQPLFCFELMTVVLRVSPLSAQHLTAQWVASLALPPLSCS